MTMEELIIRNIKTLGIDMIKKAGSGHPGIVLDAAPIMYTLFSRHLLYNVNDPHWLNRDRFVLSSGHGSALLYATMFLCGYPITLDDLKRIKSKMHNTKMRIQCVMSEVNSIEAMNNFIDAFSFADVLFNCSPVK